MLRSMLLLLVMSLLGGTVFAASEAGPIQDNQPSAAPMPEGASTPPAEPPEEKLTGFRRFEADVNEVANRVNSGFGAVFFFLPFGWTGIPIVEEVPFVVFWLVIGAVFFTVKMGFVNFRLFRHAINCVKGKYDDPNDEGEVSHFQALSSALSGTVGLGNIGGVAIAISLGGPGATLWMIIAGLLGMSTKFTECTLGQMYRVTDRHGNVSGGPMHYLAKGLEERGLRGLGMVLSVLFLLLCLGGSVGGGNMFQVYQSLGALKQTFPGLIDHEWIYGLVMAVFVGIVIIGGIKRIAQTAEKIVPAMCGLYVLAALVIIFMNIGSVPDAFVTIFKGAFSPGALFGGTIGTVIVQGFRRAAFSNEAGAGSASIAHSAAKTEEPVREGTVALLEPFIDTVVVCTMTALVIVITGAWNNTDPEFEQLRAAGGTVEGAQLTSLAFKQELPWFPYVLSFAVVLFAFSTIITWSYYGERCWTHIFGPKASLAFKVIFIGFVFLGSILQGQAVLDFSDLMILGMTLPNLLGLYFLAGKVRGSLDDYTGKLERGEFKEFK